jgi:hypothetical protein
MTLPRVGRAHKLVKKVLLNFSRNRLTNRRGGGNLLPTPDLIRSKDKEKGAEVQMTDIERGGSTSNNQRRANQLESEYSNDDEPDQR